MDALNALLKEVIGMFVDDGSLAVAISCNVAAAIFVSFRFTRFGGCGYPLCGLPHRSDRRRHSERATKLRSTTSNAR
jgi:hypothetical protein